jgi:hypothetical protein
VSAEHARRAQVLASGLLDRQWVAAQTGARLATDRDALDHYLDPATDCSPHPLYEDSWSGHTLAAYLAEGETRDTVSPHPMVDLARITAEHPEAARHAQGPLAWWVCQASDETAVPVPEGVPEVTFGRLRSAALDAAAHRRDSSDVRRAHRFARRAPAPSPAPSTDDVEDDPRRTATVLERQLVDWEAARQRPRRPGRVSIVVHITPDLAPTVRWLTRTMARRRKQADVELVVVGSGLPREVELPLAMLLAAYPGARFVPARSGIGPALCANLGIVETTGEVVVLARTTVDPPRQAFHALTTAIAEDPAVAIAQPLLVDPPGLVVSAGAVFGPGSTYPEPFLAGHPTRDARALTSREVPAPLSPVIAVRATELVGLRGFDVRVGDTMPEVDLGLRAARGGGATVVVPEEVLVITPSQTSLVDSAADDLRALRQRWPTAPPDGLAAWSRAGFEVVGNRWEDPTSEPDPSVRPLDAAPLTPRTVVRPLRVDVREGLPALRWALDIAAPSGRRGQRWGDWHFARSLAEALERRGQRVAVDTRDLRHRQSRDLDDVVLVLRGLDRVVPRPGRVNLEWVISHPDLVDREELAAFDHVYAASATWAARTTAALGVEVSPLLQCTDPRLFNPSRGRPDTGAPVLFVGNSRDVYRASVRSALDAGAEVEVHGADWERFVAPRLIASKAVANDQLGELYCSAGVVLNDHHEDMRRNGFLANRLFDVTACAARLVTDEIDGLTEVFGDVVKTFQDETEMKRLLADPAAAFPSYEARLALAATVMREHSFDHRADVLLADALRLRAR